MTPTRYFICRLAMTFGYSRKNVRMGDAAGEMHLLKEAEARLGKAIWMNVENIEELSMEYWSIRKLVKERDRVAGELKVSQQELSDAHDERAGLLGMNNDHFQELIDERREIHTQLEELARERDVIVAKAREIRRNYDGIKMKQEVLEKEGERCVKELEKTTARMDQLKREFTELKNKRHEVGERISEGNRKIDRIEAEIGTRKKDRREKAWEAFRHIGDANQKISNLSAELGVLDTQMRQLFSEIGRYVSRNATKQPACREACKQYKGLVEVMGALRNSIQYNYKLAEVSH